MSHSPSMLFPRAKWYVGQSKIKSAVSTTFARISTEPVCRALYIEARGGSGKTFFLQQVHEIVKQNETPSNGRFAQVIDLYDSDTRSGSAVESRIINALKSRANEAYRFTADEVERAFATYLATRNEYDQQRKLLSSQEIINTGRDLRTKFVQAFNTLATQHPIVLCFDTAEALVSEPPDTFLDANFPTGATLVTEWIGSVLPQLIHTLVIIAGRPLSPGRDLLYEVCKKSGLLVSGLAATAGSSTNDDHQINVLLQSDKLMPENLSRDEIAEYFDAYGRSDLKEHLAMAWDRTLGSPLLLTCLIQSLTNPQFLTAADTKVASLPAFRAFLITQMLNPIMLRQERNFAQQVLSYCLYVLSYARRGISRAQLEAILKQLELPKAHKDFDCTQQQHYTTLLDNLGDVALVKLRPETGLLYLHDELYEMIDQSQMPTALGLEEEVFGYLVEQAQQQEDAVVDRQQRFAALSNRIYYLLNQDIDAGYRAYNLETYRLFSNRETTQALALRDELRRWINLAFTDFDEENKIVIRYPNRDRLHDTQVKLTLEDIQRDDAVWLVKYYLRLNKPQDAVEMGKQIEEQFATDLGKDDYFKVDLFMTVGNALAVWRDDTAEEALVYLEQAIAVLDKGDKINQAFLRERRNFFRGELYTLAGFTRRRMNDFEGASNYYSIAAKAYHDCTEQELQDFAVPEAIAQMTINQIYIDLLQGQLNRAKIFADNLLHGKHAHDLSLSNEIMALQMSSLVLVRRAMGNDLSSAREYMEQAEEKSGKLQNRRVYAQVAAQVGTVRSEIMQLTDTVDEKANDYFDTAEETFEEVQDIASLRSTVLDHGRYWRRRGRLCRREKDMEAAEKCFTQALACFDRALEALGDNGPQLHRAELLHNKAIVLRLQGDIAATEALLDEAEQMLSNDRLTPYAQIIAGEIAFKRAQLALEREQWQRALNNFAVALARCYCFSPENSTANLFRRRFKEHIVALPDTALESMTNYLNALAQQSTPHPDTLPYQRPNEEKWTRGWQRAVEYLHETGEAIALTRGYI